jgi:uncharacterized protein (DUF488 family)
LNSKSNDYDAFSIGHSTRDEKEFLDLLRISGITRLVDIRTIPKSRHNPQFSQDVLSKHLKNVRIEYSRIKGLGGLRRPLKDSINTGWRNSSFRGYADYMQTSEFSKNLDELVELISEEKKKGGKVAFMCAEALPWRCHRSLVSDALVVRDLSVGHIMSRTTVNPHKITSFARVRGRKIIYPEP